MSKGFERRSLLARIAAGLAAITVPGTLPLFGQSDAESGRKLPLRLIVVDTRTEAKDVLASLLRGSDFARLAMDQSIDPSASTGGYLGEVNPGDLLAQLRAAAAPLKPGQISGIVRIPAGYAIVKRCRRIPTHQAGTGGQLGDGGGVQDVHYGPVVAGLIQADYILGQYPKPPGWQDSSASIRAVRRNSLASAIRTLQTVTSAANPQHLSDEQRMQALNTLAQCYTFQGEMREAIEVWRRVADHTAADQPQLSAYVNEVLGIACLHQAGMQNGLFTHPGDRCLFPVKADLKPLPDPDFAKSALAYLLAALKEQPGDLECRWLATLASDWLGQSALPAGVRFPLDYFRRAHPVAPFTDVAAAAGLDIMSNAGGIAVDDFRNQGIMDVFLSEFGDFEKENSVRYFQAQGDGRFEDRTAEAGLVGLPGALNLVHADYNNDGNLDVLLLRGAWEYPQPLSLLRGNGNGTFTDVTRQAGLTEPMATQTAAWADINNDGLLDLFVGNEKGPSKLFLNKGDGTFEDISARSGVDRLAFTKGVIAGDFNNDGLIDFYVTNMGSANFLYRNNGDNTFTEVAGPAGVQDSQARSFVSWFFDYDNDGWLDLFVSSYYNGSVDETLRTYLSLPQNGVTQRLFKNQRDGTFRDVTEEAGLNQVFLPMGSNFGDFDNDGFLDIYLGTGDPSYGSVLPNVLLHNVAGKRFEDVTASSRTGELHKGHGVSFADVSNRGHQDILTIIGGATPGDRHVFRYFRNPGNENDWIRIKTTGVKSNRAGIGARISVWVRNNGGPPRLIHRMVSSGGTFGCNPLQQHIGLGQSAKIDHIEVWWPASKTRQIIRDVKVNQFIEIREFAVRATVLRRRELPVPGETAGA